MNVEKEELQVLVDQPQNVNVDISKRLWSLKKQKVDISSYSFAS
jgi:hypothetical protein